MNLKKRHHYNPGPFSKTNQYIFLEGRKISKGENDGEGVVFEEDSKL